MAKLENKETVQAVLMADSFNDHFKPFSSFNSPSLLPLVNVPLISYALETLNRNGVEEVWILCASFVDKIKEFIKNGIEQNQTWSVGMHIQIVASEVRCFGDAMRDLDAKGKLRSDFILIDFDSITNAKLIPAIMKVHKENCKLDKGTAMTVIYKNVSPGQRTGNEVVVASDKKTNKMLYYQRIHPSNKEDKFKFPLEIFLNSPEVELHHDLLDPHIAICSASALPLFSDNFDYETRDQFIRGLVMNQEIQSDSIYVALLPNEQYAAKVSDWNAYHAVSRDVINRWVYPLVPDMGVCCMSQQYLFLRNNIYRHKTIKLQRNCSLQSDVVLHQGCSVDGKSSLSNCVFGRNCKIGKNCIVKNCYVFDNTRIEDNCILDSCIIGRNVQLKSGCVVTNGAVIADSCVIKEDSRIDGFIIQSELLEADEYSTEEFEKLGELAYKLKEEQEEPNVYNSDDDLVKQGEFQLKFAKLLIAEPNYESSAYSSRNESDEEEGGPVFQPEDSSIFLSEVIESLKRGFEEKSNAEFLVLEINSSRYAYNMALNEVNFFVVKAAFSLPIVADNPEPMKGFMQVYNYLGEKVLKNYIKGDSAMSDCLNATVECCEENENLKSKLMHIVKFFYDKDLLTEDQVMAWYEDVEMDWVKLSLQPLIKWFEEAESEESDDE